VATRTKGHEILKVNRILKYYAYESGVMEA
jgi:hypothetical protein